MFAQDIGNTDEPLDLLAQKEYVEIAQIGGQFTAHGGRHNINVIWAYKLPAYAIHPKILSRFERVAKADWYLMVLVIGVWTRKVERWIFQPITEGQTKKWVCGSRFDWTSEIVRLSVKVKNDHEYVDHDLWYEYEPLGELA